MTSLPGNASVWVLAGQSNMAGSGFGVPFESPSPSVWLFNLRDEWQIAEEPFMKHRYEAPEPAFMIMRGEKARREAQGLAVDEAYREEQAASFPDMVTRSQSNGGLGLSFGKALATAINRPVGLIYCAKGDTRMEEWAPDYSGHPYMALYRATLRRIRAVGRPLAGILWYQGESDTFDDKGKRYAERMRALVAAFRRDTGQPDLPFLYVQIATCVAQTIEELPDWNLVQETQLRLESELAPGGLVAAIDLPLCDGIHLSTRAQQRLGRRLAKLARHVVFQDAMVKRGPRPVVLERNPNDSCAVRVRYAFVNGALRPKERVAGLSICAPSSSRNLVCTAIVEEPATVHVRSYCPIPPGSQLWYGWGVMPFCNLVDGEDLAAPVFGPWPIPELKTQ